MLRRDFVKMTAVGAGAAIAGAKLLPGQVAAAAAERTKPIVGLPVSPSALAGPDLERKLEDMRARAGVNALFPFLYTHEKHRAGVFTDNFRGGNYAIPHPEHYLDTVLTCEDMRAPEFGNEDILARTVAAAQRQGMAVFPFILEDNHLPASIPHWEKLYEIDRQGRPGEHPCKNNPYYRGFLAGLMEDYACSYALGGLMWGAERQSGFLNALDLAMGGGGDPSRAACFCPFCQEKAKAAGIDVQRARLGFAAIEKFMKPAKSGPPRDGHFSAFWRILMNYPELLAWENLWVSGRHELQAEIYRRVKAARPALPMGWHIWQNITLSPFQRAEEDYATIKGYSDFVRPAVYHHCGGERMHDLADHARHGVFGDLDPEAVYALFNRFLGHAEAPYGQVSQAGLSASYVERETRRAVAGMAGASVQVWPGVDIGIPVPQGVPPCTPRDARQAVLAAFRGGASGIILSRNYIEIPPENLSAAGDALRELGLI